VALAGEKGHMGAHEEPSRACFTSLPLRIISPKFATTCYRRGVLAAERGFRKIIGYRAPKLIAALRAHDAALQRTMKTIDGPK
jgi:hypothetical protein